MTKGSNYIIFFVSLISIVLFITALVFIYKPVIIYENLSIKDSDWLAFWGSLLGFIGTISLGLLAFWQNQVLKTENEKATKVLQEANTKAIELSEELVRINLSNKLSIMSIDEEDFLKVYFEDDERKFIKLLNNHIYLSYYLNFYPEIVSHSDFVLIEFYMKNISDNYVNRIIIKELTIFPFFDEEAEYNVKLSDEYEILDKLIAPNNRIKVYLLIENFRKYLDDQHVQTYFGYMFDLKVKYSVTNIFGDIREFIVEIAMDSVKEMVDEGVKEIERNYEIQYLSFKSK